MTVPEKLNAKVLTASLITLAALFSIILPGDVAFAGVLLPEKAQAVVTDPNHQPIAMQCSNSSGSLDAFGYTSNGYNQYTIEKDSTSGFLDVNCPGNAFTVRGSLYVGEHIAPSGDIVVLSRDNTSSDPSRLRIYNDKGVFLREHLAKNECDTTALIRGFPVVNGNIVAFVYNSCQNYLHNRIKAIDIETGALVFDKAIGNRNSFQNLAWYADGFVVYRTSDVLLFAISGAEDDIDATESRRVAVQPSGTVVYTEADPQDPSRCIVNFRDTDTTLVQRSVACSQIQFFGRHTMPNGDILALGKANGNIPGNPRIIHRDGSADTELEVAIPDGVYNDSFYSSDMLVDANGKIIVTSSYQERLVTTSWPYYELKRRAVLDIFDSEGQHLTRWNSSSLGINKTFAVGDNRDYRLTNGAIYAVNNDPYSYHPSNHGLEKIVIPDISMSHRDSMRWGVGGVDLAQFELKYLALGDSVSSGEGDTERNLATGEKFYRPYTDVDEDALSGVPREKCHLSTRSYPYYLARVAGLGSGTFRQWDSVACSGAQTIDVYNESSSLVYNGQKKGGPPLGQFSDIPRLEGYSNKAALQAVALNEIIPGRVKQIEFVEKYKPNVITLTMGANNVGFGDKLADCMMDLGTCDWATTKKADLASQIQGQFSELKTLYEELYEESDNKAKIYVFGYPHLIDGSASAEGQCKNVLSLNNTERLMIQEATSYLNLVIERAANAAGVKYVDISDALSGGKLCEGGQQYVTALAWRGSSEIQETFHPNSLGHMKIAQKVYSELNGESLLSYEVCAGGAPNCPRIGTIAEEPSIPSEFGTPDKKSRNERVAEPVIERTSPTQLVLPKPLFKPNSTVEATLHSDPIELGEYTADSSGNVSGAFTIPSSAPAGHHTLILTGVTPGDEPLEVTQTVLVIGTDPDDLDDNGVLDINQPCGPFIEALGVDEDLDGIDDACDPYVSEEPELYRLRLGDVTRTYNGSPENEDYFYIERNTRASSLTGIAGDYDPDGDGWAIVGASQGIAYSPSSIPDTAPAANFIVEGTGVNAVPYVYIRAGDHGCVGFSPVSLAKVEASQSRTIEDVSYNTGKCRQEAADYDVDGDGFSDDEAESLYVARQGDGFIGEDPTRIYLFRNFYSAEAQLGISDYSPTGTPAGDAEKPIQTLNLLASIDPSEDYMLFNKLVIFEDTNGYPLPTILAKDELDQCVAFQSSDTLIIKQTTQDTRYLTKLSALPVGVSCE